MPVLGVGACVLQPTIRLLTRIPRFMAVCRSSWHAGRCEWRIRDRFARLQCGPGLRALRCQHCVQRSVLLRPQWRRRQRHHVDHERRAVWLRCLQACPEGRRPQAHPRARGIRQGRRTHGRQQGDQHRHSQCVMVPWVVPRRNNDHACRGARGDRSHRRLSRTLCVALCVWLCGCVWGCVWLCVCVHRRDEARASTADAGANPAAAGPPRLPRPTAHPGCPHASRCATGAGSGGAHRGLRARASGRARRTRYQWHERRRW